MTKTIRIGCASGFWGDSLTAAPQLVETGEIDVLVFDYLAEITMSVLARLREKDAEAGYAHDFVTQTMPAVAHAVKAKGIKVVSNAGGVNPGACARHLERVLEKLGVDLKVAWIEGDELIHRLDELGRAGIREMFTGDAMPPKPLSANAYLGCFPIAAALASGADIVITGRCADSAVVLGPVIHAFGLQPTDHDALAGASLAGHIAECGAQACGGNFTDWHLVPSWETIGYSIVEVAADGTFVATKPAGSGGLVSRGTVGEQLLYEIGDPQAYMLPDVVCDFSGVTLEEVGPDRMRVSGCRGYPATPAYKASLTFEDGWRAGQYLTIGGIDAAKKARHTGEVVLKRMAMINRQRNWGDFTETSIEVIGDEDSYGMHRREHPLREAVLKLAAKHPRREPLEMMLRELTSSATSFAPGTCGFQGVRFKAQPMVRHFACLVPKGMIVPKVHVHGQTHEVPIHPGTAFDPAAIVRPRIDEPKPVDGPFRTVPLVRLAYGRSGDKGDNSNIGIMARKAEWMPLIRAALTPRAVAEWFAHKLGPDGRVERFDLPGLPAVNFLLHHALGGGGMASIANDPQGKAYAQMLLEFPVPVPASLAAALEAEAEAHSRAGDRVPA